VNLDASGHASITAAQVDNGSSDNCAITNRVVSPSSFDCTKVGANTVTLTVTDSSGNSASSSAIVTVHDITAPTVVTKDIDVNLDASGHVTIAATDVNNGSSDSCGSLSYSLDKSSFDCSNVGANTVSLTVTDANGNHASASATVTVHDVTPPTIACPADISVFTTNAAGTVVNLTLPAVLTIALWHRWLPTPPQAAHSRLAPQW